MKTVLIIDDSPFMRSVIKTIVNNNGYNVIGEAENGKIGVERCRELSPDIITLDVTMDEMDGLTALEHIMKINAKTVVIILSAIAGQKWFVDRAKELGAKTILTKPVDPKHLISTLNFYTKAAEEPAATPSQWSQLVEMNPDLLKVFRHDIEQSIIVLRIAVANGDIKTFTTTVHAIKSALANIEENEESAFAAELEKAGLRGDMDFISQNAEKFLEMLAKHL
jgi:two-component system chemotaxis response regulator CheY